MTTLIQFSAGRGPLECSRAVGEISKIFLSEAKSEGAVVSLVESEPDGKRGCYKSMVFALHGNISRRFRESWLGTLQWIEQSPFRKGHKRKNWFISANELPLVEERSIDMRDIRVDTMRSSGAGGQHVNKTDSAVRITHLPSGVSVSVSAERSQIRNRKLALSLLASKLDEIHIHRQREQEQKNWQNHNELVRGNPVRLFRK